MNFKKLYFITIVFQNNHDSYRVCRGRNMSPFYSYENLKKKFIRNYLSKTGPR